MKKIILAGLFAISSFAMAQETSDNPYVYDTQNEAAEGDTFPGNPGDPNPAPVDQCVPFLLLTAIGMVVVFARKRKMA